MPEPTESELDLFLSRGRLGREHKQRVLQEVLASVRSTEAGRRRSRWRWPAFAMVSLSGAVVVAALWARPPQDTRSALREKGATPAVPVIAMSCLGGSLAGCPVGSRLAFWVEGGPAESGVVTAYADRVAGGERVWYLTNQAVPRAALIDRQHASGEYRVRAVLTRHPVPRAEIARLAPDVVVTTASFSLVVSP